MFVEINNSELSAIDIDKEVKVRRNNDGKFTPELAVWALSKTNNFANIKFLISNIKQRPQEEWGEYKNFVLSCVDGRELSKVAFNELHELAKLGGYEEEFNKINKNDKIYNKEVCMSIDVNSIEELKNALSKGIFVKQANLTTPKYCDVDLKDLDFSNVYKINCKGDATWYFNNSILPSCLSFDVRKASLEVCDFKNVRQLDCCNSFSGEIVVNMYKAENLSSKVDLTGIDDLSLFACDLSGFEELKFKEYARVNLSWAYNLPKVIDADEFYADVSLYNSDLTGVEKLCLYKNAKLAGAKNLPKNLSFKYLDNVLLDECDLSGVEEINLLICKKVNMSKCTNLPKVLDFSKCNMVYLDGADLSGVDKIISSVKYMEFYEVNNLPKVLDLRNCEDVAFNNVNLSGVEKIQFKEGSDVWFRDACELPKKLDVSMCGFVDFNGCDMMGVESIKFRDKIQMKYFMEGAINFSGEVKYEISHVCGDVLKKETMNIMKKLYEAED
jgi:uncharacterized protein YjbI with pentapeptide repeats